MSLVSLTFGKGKELAYSQIEVSSPADSICANPSVENRVEVKKISTFFNTPGIYIVGEVISGIVKEGMQGECNGLCFDIEEVESKLGPAAKQGMNVGIGTTDLVPESIKPGDVISIIPGE